MSYQIIADYACQLGEGPIWHPLQHRVYWTDIVNRRLYYYEPSEGIHQQCEYDGPMVGGITVQADGALLLFREKGNIVIWRDGKVEKTICREISGEQGHRFNDVWADPEGRVFCGTMGFQMEPGRFYRLELDGSLTKLLDDVKVSNGMGLTPDGSGLYYTETLAGTIWIFDYDRATGSLSNQRPFSAKSDVPGQPDGLVMDARGRLWSARWEGGCIVCIGPDGALVQSIDLPARQVTSACFGGVNLATMYVTTAGGQERPDTGKYAGALFAIDAGVTGAQEHFSRVGL